MMKSKQYIRIVLAEAPNGMRIGNIVTLLDEMGWEQNPSYRLPRNRKIQLVYMTLREHASMFSYCGGGVYKLAAHKTHFKKRPTFTHNLIQEVFKCKGASLGAAAIWRELQARKIIVTYSAVRESLRRKFKRVNGRYYLVRETLHKPDTIANTIRSQFAIGRPFTMPEARDYFQSKGIEVSTAGVMAALNRSFTKRGIRGSFVYYTNRKAA